VAAASADGVVLSEKQKPPSKKTKSGRKRPLINNKNLFWAVHEEQPEIQSVSHPPLEKEASQEKKA